MTHNINFTLKTLLKITSEQQLKSEEKLKK